MAQSIHYIQGLHSIGWSLVHNLPTCVAMPTLSILWKTQLKLSIVGRSAVYEIVICRLVGRSLIMAQSIHHIQCIHSSGGSLGHNLPTCIALPSLSVLPKI
jgi:hypothetical protein